MAQRRDRLPAVALLALLVCACSGGADGDGASGAAEETPRAQSHPSQSLSARRIAPLVERLEQARRSWIQTSEGRAEHLPQAVRGLVELGPQVVPYVVPALESPRADTRYFAAMVLGQVGDARLVEPMIRLLDDPDDGVTAMASEALGRLRDRHTIPMLFRALETDRVRQIRWARVVDPVRTADRELVPFLIGRLLDGNASSRLSAALLLTRITGEEIPFDPGADRATRELAALRWEAWWKREGNGAR